MRIVDTRGFTLVEVVVAITILSMVMLGTMTALRTFGRTQVLLEDVSDRTQSMRQVSSLLRRVLVNAQPVTGGASNNGFYLYGNEQSLTWVAPFSASHHLGGMMVFRLTAEDNQLLINFAPYKDAKEPEWSDLSSYILLEDLDEFSLAYRLMPGEDWQLDWSQIAHFPDAVRFSMAVKGRYWPDLIIRFNDVQAAH